MINFHYSATRLGRELSACQRSVPYFLEPRKSLLLSLNLLTLRVAQLMGRSARWDAIRRSMLRQRLSTSPRCYWIIAVDRTPIWNRNAILARMSQSSHMHFPRHRYVRPVCGQLGWERPQSPSCMVKPYGTPDSNTEWPH